MNNCIVFVTHKITDEIIKYLNYLQYEAEGLADLVIMFDNSSNEIKADDYPQFNFFVFDSQSPNFFLNGDKRLPCPYIPLLDFQKQCEYSHYLLMENDIVLKDSFREFLTRLFADSDVDYVHIAKDILGSPYAHWPIKYIKDFPYEKIFFSWSQIFYCSRSFLTCLSEEYNKNNSIFYEFFLPSIAYNKHFRVKQFENYGYDFRVSWGPAEMYEQLYCLESYRKVFYHPVKNLGIVDFNGLKHLDSKK